MSGDRKMNVIYEKDIYLHAEKSSTFRLGRMM